MRKYRDIKYTLTRSKRKTASIYIERNGRVSVIVPKTLTTKEVEELIERKRKWIYTSLAEWHDMNATKVKREFVNGEGFLYLGRSYRLKRVREQETPLLLKDGYFCLRTGNISRRAANVAFREFYRDKGKQRIPDRVAYFADRMGVSIEGIKVIDLKNHWASCSPSGFLNFHWKCMMAPLTILDYIIVHELAHLIHANHTMTFWNEVDKILQDYGERKEWLKVNGAGMDL